MRAVTGVRRAVCAVTMACAAAGGVVLATPDAIAGGSATSAHREPVGRASVTGASTGNATASVPLASFGPTDGLPHPLERGRRVVAVISVWLAPNAITGDVVVRAFGVDRRCDGASRVKPGTVARLRCEIVVRGTRGGSFDIVATIRLADGSSITRRYPHTIDKALQRSQLSLSGGRGSLRAWRLPSTSTSCMKKGSGWLLPRVALVSTPMSRPARAGRCAISSVTLAAFTGGPRRMSARARRRWQRVGSRQSRSLPTMA